MKTLLLISLVGLAFVLMTQAAPSAELDTKVLTPLLYFKFVFIVVYQVLSRTRVKITFGSLRLIRLKFRVITNFLRSVSTISYRKQNVNS